MNAPPILIDPHVIGEKGRRQGGDAQRRDQVDCPDAGDENERHARHAVPLMGEPGEIGGEKYGETARREKGDEPCREARQDRGDSNITQPSNCATTWRSRRGS
jgi:hypothetical protein